MLAKAAVRRHAFSGNFRKGDNILLPFLYCTKTIARSYADGQHSPRRRNRRESSDAQSFATPRSRSDSNTQYHSPGKGVSTSNLRDGQAEYKINEPWEDQWMRSKPRAPAAVADNSYVPFSETPGRSDDDAGMNDFYVPPRERSRRPNYPESNAVDKEFQNPSQKQGNRTPFIPFERPAARPDPYADLEGTTITPTEKKAFESLFKLKSTRSPQEAKKSEQSQGNLDNILDSALSKFQDSGPKRRERPAPEFPAPLRGMANEAAAEAEAEEATAETDANDELDDEKFPLDRDAPRQKTKSKPTQAEFVARAARSEIIEVKRLLNQAETDVEVWRVMCSKILQRAVDLELDGPDERFKPRTKGKKKDKVKSDKATEQPASEQASAAAGTKAAVEKPSPSSVKPTLSPSEVLSDGDSLKGATDGRANVTSGFPSRTVSNPKRIISEPTDLQVLTIAFPKLLRHVYKIFTTLYPASPLPIAIFPLLKSLGPATSALGLSTELYNTHMLLLYKKYTDLYAIISTLEEMDREVYEFDFGTAALLRKILNKAVKARSGELGDAMSVLWRTEMMERALRELSKWQKIVEERRQEAALRRAREEEDFREQRMSLGGRSPVQDLEDEEPFEAIGDGTDEFEGNNDRAVNDDGKRESIREPSSAA